MEQRLSRRYPGGLTRNELCFLALATITVTTATTTKHSSHGTDLRECLAS